MKKNLSWKMMLGLFVVFEILAHVITLLFASTALYFIQAIVAVFEIGALLMLILGFVGMIKAGFQSLWGKKKSIANRR